MQRLPELVKKTGNGKGKPVRMTLTPISQIRKALNVEVCANIIYRFLDNSSIMSIMQVTVVHNKVKILRMSIS